ncbi:hypothetical protein PUZ93_001310 [Cronobacter turicensis]|nr:hypothetical protein [Cronobacter turicensis]
MLEQQKQSTVIVNNGSGVAVPAMASQYSYVLTARHNLQADPKNRETLLPLEDIRITYRDGQVIEPKAIFSSHTEDAAILLIEGVQVEPLVYSNDVIEDQASIAILGYPATRRNGTGNSLKTFRGEIQDFEHTRINVSTSSFASQDEIMGVSGGGVFSKRQNEWVLIGIEYSMEGPENESQNWLSCVRIGIFEKIIADSSFQELHVAPILPPYLLDFLQLVEYSFPLEGFECERTQRLLRQMLWDVAKEKLTGKCPSPHSIMQKFGDQLLVAGDPLYRLADRKLWLSWVEFLVMCVLLDSPQEIDHDYIEKLRKRRRLFYSGSDREWTSYLEAIAKSNFIGLESDGVVLITTNRTPVKTRPAVSFSKLVMDICRPNGSNFDIGASAQAPKDLKLMHIDGLNRDCLVLNEQQYPHGDAFDRSIAITLITEAYRAAKAQ